MTNVNYGKCNNGTGGVTFPQLTVYDSMILHNKSIKFYINLTNTQVWNDDGDKGHDHRSAPCSDAAAGQGIMGGSEFPDICMDGIARHKNHFMNYSTFFVRYESSVFVKISQLLSNSMIHTPCVFDAFLFDSAGGRCGWHASKLRNDPAQWLSLRPPMCRYCAR